MNSKSYRSPPESLPAVDCRLLECAEGFLALELPLAAVDELRKAGPMARAGFAWNLLMGEALRNADRWHEAVPFLERAHDLRPEALAVLLSLGWCFKRSCRIDRAIDSLQEAAERCRKHDRKTLSLVHYNLGCYYALAGRKHDALDYLARAVRRNVAYLDAIAAEADLAELRTDREFQELVERWRQGDKNAQPSGSIDG